MCIFTEDLIKQYFQDTNLDFVTITKFLLEYLFIISFFRLKPTRFFMHYSSRAKRGRERN
jgi:hypothetical protein